MSYHDRLASLRKIQKGPVTALTEPTKGASGSSDSADPGPFQKNPARHACLAEAALAAGLHTDTLEALLSPEDREDLAAGMLKSEELGAYASRVVGRWKAGAVLPDERRLYWEYLNDKRPHSRGCQGSNLEEAQHGEK
ncbi:MAG: hypothetical protein ACQETK_05690 [Pseudomonadota bacterium]